MESLTAADTYRLAFSRYLISKAQEQAKLSAPLNASAILSTHDAVELFLIVASQKHNIDPNKTQFMGFWDAFRRKGVDLPYKEAMRHLNDCRVGVKHRGTFPSDFDIERVVADAEAFLEEATLEIFSVSLSDMSLLNFITYEKVREYLTVAQTAFDKGDYIKSIENSALAFSQLEENFIESRRVHAWDRPYEFNQFSTFDNGFFAVGGDSKFREVRKFIDKVTESVKATGEAVKIIAIGINYDSYERFKQLTPNVVHFASGKMYCSWNNATHDAVKDSPKSAKWCLEFVTESALHICSKANPFAEAEKQVNSKNLNDNGEKSDD